MHIYGRILATIPMGYDIMKHINFIKKYMDENTHVLNVHRKPKGVTGLIIIFILLLVVCYFFFKFLNPSTTKPATPSGISTTLPANYHVQVIAQNQYPAGFPVSVIVQNKSKNIVGVWSRSEDTITADGKRLKIVELMYKGVDPATLAPLFENSFKADKWVMDTTKSGDTPVVRVFDGVISGIKEVATVTIIKVNDTDSLVNITITT
jgi:hypothetical protein